MKTTENITTVDALVKSLTLAGGRVYEVRNPNRPNEFGVMFPPNWDNQRRSNFIAAASAAHGMLYFESCIH